MRYKVTQSVGTYKAVRASHPITAKGAINVSAVRRQVLAEIGILYVQPDNSHH
jgi:hypothetical protein